MGDSYRPGNRFRGRDYDYSERERRDYYDADSQHRRQDRRRSRSPPRSLDYDDGPHDRDYSRRMPDGGEHLSDGYGVRKPGAYRNPSPLRRPRYDRDYDYHHERDTWLPPEPPNFGEKDGAKDERPSTYVLVRGLKESASEEIFAKGMEKLYDGFDNTFSGATPKSIRRVFIIRDRKTRESMGFGFVQYHTVSDAQAAVKKARQMEQNGDRLTISSKEFSISFAHGGVFPHYDYDGIEHDSRFLFQGNDKMHKYHDRRYYPRELMVNEESPHTPEPVIDDTTTKKAKKSAKDTLENKAKKQKTTGAAPAFLGYFQQKQAELREQEESATRQSESTKPKQPATGVNTISADTTMSEAATENTEPPSQTFAHESDDLIACYLCKSRFNTREGIVRHIKESEMHAKYSKDDALVYRAHERMKDKGISLEETIKLEQPQVVAQPVIRDRAAERRQQQPSAKIGFSLKQNKLASGNSSSSSSNPAGAAENYGKGAALLAKSGWQEGQGLGAAGSEGRAEALSVQSFAPGVGLGHQGSKQGDAVEEAARATKGDGFVEMGREKTRRRWEGNL